MRDPATGKVVRTALPVFVGAAATPVTAGTIPALAASPRDVSRADLALPSSWVEPGTRPGYSGTPEVRNS